MANIKFSRKEFEKNIKLTREVEQKISAFGTHLESVNENEIELEIMPNRPDLFSLQTFIKSLSSFMGKKPTGLREYKINKPEKDFQVTIKKSTENIRPFTACAIVKNLKFDDEKIKEIVDIQEKIHSTLGRNRKKVAIGIYPLEKITLPITLEAKKPQDIKFKPLEMEREMNGLQILQQHPTGREYANLLEGKSLFPIFIDAKGDVLSMPPIINSHKTGKITEKTKDIFIECSGFDFKILKKALNILIVMLAEMNGEVYQMNLVYEHNKLGKNKKIQTPDLTPEKIKLLPENANRLLGLSLKENEIKTLLEKMGYNYNTKTRIAEAPAWRTDIMHEVDLIEDIAIAYGYDNFQPEIPSIATSGDIHKIEIIKKKISEVLCGLNISEVLGYHLLTQEDARALSLNPEKDKNIIEVEKSKSEYKYLRPSLLSSALKILSKNTDNEYPQRIFELGKSFEKDKTGKEETGISEPEKLCIAIANTNTNFTEIKQIFDYLARMLNKEYSLENFTGNNHNFIEGRTAEIKVNNRPIGIMGEISPQTLVNLGIKMPLAALEIDINELIK